MIRILFALLFSSIILSACGASYDQKNYKKYTGISYQEYEAKRKQHQQEQEKEKVEYLYQRDVEEDNIDLYPSVTTDIIEEDVIESVNSSYGEAVVVMASKKISLGKDASYKDMQLFQNALDSSYKMVFSRYRADGFTYAMSPAGTVNPLSVMEVQCKLSENYATAKGKALCDYFFEQISNAYAKEQSNVGNK